MIRNRFLLKVVSLTMLVTMLSNIFYPTVSYALTSGPSQPEFSSFEPVTTTNMVNEFTGDFVYNLPIIEVPGPHGSSYPLSLSYHSGTTPEEEASWVGYGWTLNPGAINRNKRGFADDQIAKFKYHNKRPSDVTVTAGLGAGLEAGSLDLAQLTAGVRYNNYRGFGYTVGIGRSFAGGIINLGYNISNHEGRFSLDINAMRGVQMGFMKVRQSQNKTRGYQLSSLGLKPKYGITSYAYSNYASGINDYHGTSVKAGFGILTAPFFPQAGPNATIDGSVNVTKFEESEESLAFGYLYSSLVKDDDVNSEFQIEDKDLNLMDYYLEKDNPYDKRDIHIGIPFTNSDLYAVTGANNGGTFKLQKPQLGYFRPGESNGTTVFTSVGVELNTLANWGSGFDISASEQWSKEGDWSNEADNNFGQTDFSSADETFFRYTQDPAQSWIPSAGTQKVHGGFESSSNLFSLGSKNFKINFSQENQIFNDGLKARTSSNISYTLNEDFNKSNYLGYQKRADIEALVNRAAVPRGIGEIAIFDAGGTRSVYGLPVYNKNEKTLSYGGFNSLGNNLEKNFLIYNIDPENDTRIKSGFESVGDASYASTYLLTEVVSPNYVDVDLLNPNQSDPEVIKNLGPSRNDLGGYTKFNYHKEFGDNSTDGNGDFKWRLPYNGLQYQKNELSDPLDDIGSVQSGEKEIYYLQSVETKTHAAIFVLNDNSVQDDKRKDGLSAAESNEMSKNQPGNSELRYLKSIELYSIDQVEPDVNNHLKPISGAIPLKKVFFQYDNSLSPGLPNSANGAGKLTLRRIWMEYQNATSRVSPYKFDYNYPTSLTHEYPEVYEDFLNSSALLENPQYNGMNPDGWGNLLSNAENRHENMRPGVDQKPAADFDPAAWHLKAITLPSGGEIHVQYEQDDYFYVQDQQAHVLTKLTGNIQASINDADGKTFELDLGGLDIPIEDKTTTIAKLRDDIHNRYVDNKEKMFFKILYNLYQEVPTTPDLNECSSEFITGYANVESVAVTGENITLVLKDNKGLPVEVCQEYYKANRFGNIYSGNCDASDIQIGIDPDNPVQGAIGAIENTFSKGASLFGAIGNMNSKVCQSINYEHSYFRIPVPTHKKGGGVRVKRLLLYDEGTVNGEEQLFGNEYVYQTMDDNGYAVSSGVATNEPSSMREENILVNALERKRVSFDKIDQLIAGRDKEQLEGPFGESVYPGPSVGYSKIIIKDINPYKYNTGFQVNEYYTAKEHPVDFDFTDLKRKKEYFPLPTGLVNNFVHRTWNTQGFVVKLNQMHGKMKSSSSYAGTFENRYLNTNTLEASANLVRSEKVEYHDPGKAVLTVDDYMGVPYYSDLGTEVEVTVAQKGYNEELFDVSVESDVSVGIIAPVPFLPGFVLIPQYTVIPSITHYGGGNYQHANSKIISYPAIVKSQVVTQDGISHHTNYTVFDQMTGNPVVVESFDEFDAVTRSYNINGSWVYKNLGDKGQYEGQKITASFDINTEESSGLTYIQLQPGSDHCEVYETLAAGDIIDLAPLDNDVSDLVYTLGEYDPINEWIPILPTVESTGALPTSITELKVLRSGRMNMVASSVGSVVFHESNVPEIDLETSRWDDSGQFLEDFNNGIAEAQNQDYGNFELTGPYTGIKSSAIDERLPDGCGTYTIQSIKYGYARVNGELNISILEAVIDCNNTGIETIK